MGNIGPGQPTELPECGELGDEGDSSTPHADGWAVAYVDDMVRCMAMSNLAQKAACRIAKGLARTCSRRQLQSRLRWPVRHGQHRANIAMRATSPYRHRDHALVVGG